MLVFCAIYQEALTWHWRKKMWQKSVIDRQCPVGCTEVNPYSIPLKQGNKSKYILKKTDDTFQVWISWNLQGLNMCINLWSTCSFTTHTNSDAYKSFHVYIIKINYELLNKFNLNILDFLIFFFTTQHEHKLRFYFITTFKLLH